MRRNNIYNRFGWKWILPLLLLIPVAACNEKADPSTDIDTTSLAVSSFSIKLNREISGLDSVYFAIDLDHGVIYNPDSLAPGTPINRLVATIGYSSAVDKAVIVMENDTATNEINYMKNPTDSIDFTGKVTFTLSKGDFSKSYRIKVNVHNEYADSLRWDEFAMAKLPSRLSDPVAQKTVTMADTTAVCLIQEKDGSFTMSASHNLIDNIWDKKEVSLPFTPDISSFTAAENKIYILNDKRELYEGDLTGAWTNTGRVWESIIGGYLNTVVGLESNGATTVFAQYPQTDLDTSAPVPATFPHTGYSTFVTLKNKWTNSPVAFFVGGRQSDGALSNDTWAFDGENWVTLNDGDVPELEGATIVPYYYYRTTTSGNTLVEFNVWMLLGGKTKDGYNRDVYISYNNSVNWAKGSELMQLPKEFPAMSNCDNIVMSTEKKANIANNWKIVKRSGKKQRLPYQVDGETIIWECPYIYLIGGIGEDGKLCNSIWRGVLSRLTFVPII